MLGRFDAETILATLLAFVVAITIHEFAHAWTALRLGDDTAARLGRVTLNPLAHLDPIGSIGLLLIVFLGFGIGWGRPVPVNPNRLRWGHRGMALTALAGPLSNVILALAFALPYRIGLPAAPEPVMTVVQRLILVNLLLAAFNLIPIPPLDGLKILLGILPAFWYPVLAPLERYGVGILLVLIVFGSVGGSILAAMYLPVYRLLFRLVVGQSPL
ncbi:site-2 protease family protein [Thermomicrobium sp. 4228-Ro]|uniref:site-2 protease family protein n=1 Tax=Thermomicrobium sp. 4228-Ro TaxID=2993937 RepID=UPI002249880F|nr:site-2 protease family protein [Thermomicrobium sp. 4228-Ro]MCX2727101.1 site-2 protease family protein [Thermomicrobium sp. 4228-Ro]